MISNIEDLVTYICTKQQDKSVLLLDQRDKTFLFSLSAQFKKSLALTANQAKLLMKILEEKKDQIVEVDWHRHLIENPVFKYPFRTIDQSKTISLIKYKNEQCISIKFPFDRKMNETLHKITIGRYGYVKELKSYVYAFSIDNLFNILKDDNVRQYGFTIHESLTNFYEKINKIRENPESHKPLLEYEDRIVIKNSNRFLKKYFDENQNGDMLHDLFLGKTLGLTPSKKLIESLNSMNLDQKSLDILLGKNCRFVTSNRSEFNKSALTCFLKSVEQWPVLFILEDDQMLYNSLNEWHQSLNNIGIDNNKMSVLSRSVDDQQFNSYIKDHRLNNLVDEKTKVVFIKNKIPKVLYKIDFKPKIVVSMSTFYVHFSTQKLLDSHPFIIFYTDQILNTSAGKEIAKL
jgi:hypothetical protein